MEKERTVAILTPYLSENLPSVLEKRNGLDRLICQIVEYGYDPIRNFSRVDKIKTKKDTLRLIYPNYGQELMTTRQDMLYCATAQSNILSIMGSTEDSEDLAVQLKGSGILIGRYSIFYGKNSEYTKRSPSQSGYSFDIPKNPDAVLRMLQEDEFLDAVEQKNKSKIESALENINKGLVSPILTTKYLKEALNINR